MSFKNFEELIASVRSGSKKRVIVAAAHDEHALEAVLKAHDEGVINYVLVGIKDQIMEKAKKLGYTVDENEIVETAEDKEAAFKAVELVREGKGDFLMKGKLETATLLKEVVNKETGIGMGGVMSHVALIEISTFPKLFCTTDGGMILNPTLEQKIGIVENAVRVFHGLGEKCPKVAVLAAVEVVNPKMQETVDAAELKKLSEGGRFGECILEGPISCDLTFSKEAADIKGYKSPVTGDADILIVPNIATGNIMSKALICLSGAKMAGCIVGAKVPIVLTSRGSSFEEKYNALMLCAAQA